jgi:polar amino acid transport system substrate-binding protein
MSATHNRLGRRILAGTAVGLATAALIRPAAAQQTTANTLDAIQRRGSVRVGWGVIYPNMYREPGKQEPVGMYIDLLEDLAKSLNVRLELVEDNWSTMVAGLQANKFDMTIPLAITLPRAMSATFSKPFMQSPVGLMIRKADAGRFQKWQDMDIPSARISVTLGSNADMFASRAFSKAQILRVRAAPDSITQLLTGRAEAWGSPVESFPSVAAERQELQVLAGPPIGFSQSSFAVRLGDFAWRDWLGYFTTEMIDTGAMQRILAKYNRPDDILVR